MAGTNIRPAHGLRILFAGCVAMACCRPAPAMATDAPPPARQSLDDVWFTGPMLANSAATLPQGHWLLEPYLYDERSSHADGYGSLTYMLYGVTDRLTMGLIPVFGYNRVDGGPDSSGVGVGDVSVLAQYRLVAPPAESSLPTVSIQLEETLPTGAYDRLGNRPADGLGSGARITTLALNTQTWFWLPNGRILRMRLNLSRTFAGHADVDDVSVYGTSLGFHGQALPGATFGVDAALEYSLTRQWALAFDLTWSHRGNTRVRGYDVPEGSPAQPPLGVRQDSGSSAAFGFAPAVEYSWNAHVGLLAGVRVITGGRRTTTTVTPALALNVVY